MRTLSRWVLPIAMVAIGIAILSGYLIPALPGQTGLRTMMGLVAILLGLFRFFLARTQSAGPAPRRFGGQRHRPWERP
jgi:hypothetical protein